MREMSERLKIIGHCPVKVFIASYIPRYWYPYRLQHANEVRSWLADESLETIVDSAIGDGAVGNETVLDRAHEASADYVVPADVLHEQTATTDSVREFTEMYESHPCAAKPLIPLQPPYDRHYRELDGFGHYALGGIADEPANVQLKEIRKFRTAAGPYVHAHGLGLGASLTTIRAIRAEPELLDSLDLSTPERIVRSDEMADKTWTRTPHEFPRGEDSTVVRAHFASAIAIQLNYMLGPFCRDDILEQTWEQSTLGVTNDE